MNENVDWVLVPDRDEPNAEHRRFAETLAEAIVARDHAAAHAMLAGWLQRIVSAEDLRRLLDRYCEIIAESIGRGLMLPAEYSVHYSDWNLEYLTGGSGWGARPREGGRIEPDDLIDVNWGIEDDATLPIPPENTDENFRAWISIEFTPTPQERYECGIDCYFQLGFILVEEAGRLRVGYFHITGAD